MLGQTQREFLRGEGPEPRSSHGRTVRTRIRERVRAGLYDFELLSQDLSDRDIEQIAGSFEDPQLRQVLEETVAFLYLLGDHAGSLDAEGVIDQGVMIGRGVRAEALLERFREDPDSLTFGEVRELQLSGKLTDEVWNEAYPDDDDDRRPPIGNVSEGDRLFFGVTDADAEE